LRLLDSLRPLFDEVSRILVVDNGSEDSSASLPSGISRVEVLELHDNQGFAGAANRGIAETDSSYVLLLNPDITIVPETVRNLQEEMGRYPRLGIGCSALFGENGKSQESFQIRSFPTVARVVKEALFIDEILSLFKLQKQPSSNSGRVEAREVEQPAAAFWLMRREAWEQIGGFDEAFFPAWFEDVDFCRRLTDAGWKIMFFPQWRVIHRGGLSLERLEYKSFLKIYYSNLLKYWKKHHRVSLPLIWLPVQLGLVVRRMLAR
jgi:GT2 family glycosyltransferase